MDLEFLQANINHCARAQDLLYQSVAERLINVVVASEPYYVPSWENWAGDLDGKVIIGTMTTNGSPDLELVERGRGYVAGRVGDVLVVGVYFSPNRSLAEFERLLDEVGALIGRNGSNRTLLAGDFNAKSEAWGCPRTSARGAVLEEFAVGAGLVVLNRGTVNTCVRQQGGSIVDVTFAGDTVARRVKDWKVLEDVETLSDHLYVRFGVSAATGTLSDPSRPLVEGGDEVG